ncbi:MAG: molybdopterin molybdotransferase, partial [Alphaproteobacteria bacterium]
MLSVKEAQDRILSTITPMPAEQIGMANGLGRVLAEDIASRRTQPPTDVSAMDGYAVRAADVATVPTTLKIIGHAPAGGEHDGALGAGEAVRIFTGGPVPNGADAIVIQEDT